MKRVKFIALFVLLIMAVGALTACGSDTDLAGRWSSNVEGDTAWYSFDEDGTGVREILPGMSETFSWEVVGSDIVMNFPTHEETWGFSIRRNTLTFTSPDFPGVIFPYGRD